MSAATARSAAQTGSPTLSTDHARRLRRLARLLEIPPEKLHLWLLSSQLERYEDPGTGALENMARALPGSDKHCERIHGKVSAWMRKRRAKAA